MDVALEQFFSLSLRETFRNFPQGRYSRFICVKRICIEKVKLLDQCQDTAKKEKRRQWDVSKG